MKRNHSIRLKAFVLLFVFTMNMIVGLACSAGIGMGFNKSHHAPQNSATAVHIHKDGKKHVHHTKKAQHKKESDEKKNCCSDEVVAFNQAGKSVPKAVSITQPFCEATVAFQYPEIYKSFRSATINKTRQFTRSYHPPIPDIRIAIQSFQV